MLTNRLHPVPALANQGATAAKGICRPKIRTNASNSNVKPESFPAKPGSIRANRPSANFSRRAHLEHAFVLEEIQMPVALRHRIMNRMHAFVAGDREAAPRL